MSHTEKPMCSARIDQKRLRRATKRPSVSQNVSSSGFQFAIHRDMALFLLAGCRDELIRCDAGNEQETNEGYLAISPSRRTRTAQYLYEGCREYGSKAANVSWLHSAKCMGMKRWPS